MDSRAAREYILKRLKDELPEDRTYHSLSHTLDVYAVAVDIAECEGVEGESLQLLKTAALFHDCGFIYNPLHHEERGCELVRENLSQFGYDEEAIASICDLIMATKVPQSPKNKLEEILCDADLDYLGRSDFEQIGGRLFAEFRTDGVVENELDWDELQVKFISQHRYFTKTNRESREDSKRLNLQKVIDRVESRK